MAETDLVSIKSESRPGPAGVAAILLTMGKPLADKVLQHFDETEVEAIAAAAATLGPVSRQSIDRWVHDLTEAVEEGADILGSPGVAKQLLDGVVSPEKLTAIMSSLGKEEEKTVWPQLNDLPESIVCDYLLRQHPQVAAFALSRAGGAIAAAALRRTPGATRSEIVRRILTMRPITQTALGLLESALREELLEKAKKESAPPVHARVADIINKMDRKQMDEVLVDLESRRPKDAKLVRGLLFTFDDVVKLSTADRVKLFDGVPVERCIQALHGAAPELAEVVLSSVSTRSRRMIEQELSGGVSPPARDIAKARRAIADQVLDMAERGLIDIAQREAIDDESL